MPDAGRLEMSHFSVIHAAEVSQPLSPPGWDSDLDNYEQVEGKVIKPPVVVYSSQELGDLICAGHLETPKYIVMNVPHLLRTLKPRILRTLKASPKNNYSLPLSKKCRFSPTCVCIC